MDQVFDLFDCLGVIDEQLDFLVIYVFVLNGIVGMDVDDMVEDMILLFQVVIDKVLSSEVDFDGFFQMQISFLDYFSFLGVIGIGWVKCGKIKVGFLVKIVDCEGKICNGKIFKIMGYYGLDWIDVFDVEVGDIICIIGIDELFILDMVCLSELVEVLLFLIVDELIVSMIFQVNIFFFVGKEGKFVILCNICECLEKELIYNVVLWVEDIESFDCFWVFG